MNLLQIDQLVRVIALISLMLIFQIKAFHQYNLCDRLLASLQSKSILRRSNDPYSLAENNPFIEKSSYRRSPSLQHMVTRKEEENEKNDWTLRILSKNKESDKKKEKDDSKSEGGSWFSRVSRKVFSKSDETTTEEKKKRDLFKLGQVSSMSNREDLTEEENNSKPLLELRKKEIQEKQELRKKELLAKSAVQKEESKNRYKKQMELLQRNKAVVEAASSAKFNNPLFLSKNTTLKDTIKSKETIKEKDRVSSREDTNTTKSWSTNVANFASNLWETTVKSSSTKTKKEEWITVCPKTRISPNQIVPVVAAGLDLLLVASKDGKRVYCIANSCPHLGTPLDLGTLERKPKEPLSSNDKIKQNRMQNKSLDNMFFNNDDGCEDCIVCPLHRTAFALQSGEVRGEWCPYPPVVGKLMGTVKTKSNLPTFEIRVRGKNIEVRISSDLSGEENGEKKNFLDIF